MKSDEEELYMITTVTINDDDKPGRFKIVDTDLVVYEDSGEVKINISRVEGCKGDITCFYKTMTFEGENWAKEYDMSKLAKDEQSIKELGDFVAIRENRLTLKHAEMEKEIIIKLNPKDPTYNKSTKFIVKL